MQAAEGSGRRRFLIGAAASLTAPAVFARSPRPRLAIRVASNQGVENAALQQLMLDRGYLRDLSLDTAIVESRSISGPLEALVAGQADVCMVSGFVGVLPAIEKGEAVRLIGAAMLLPALAVYTTRSDIRRVEHLVGKTVGVGATNGLLHLMMLALLRKKGVDPRGLRFVNAGSNAQVLDAVVAGTVDAGPSGPAGLSNGAVRVLDDGRLWRELPEYTYQPAYASVQAIQEKAEALARCLAAYARLYRYLSGPSSRSAYLDARRRAANEPSTAEGEAVWKFIQQQRPYALDPGISPRRVAYLQALNVAAGLQSKILPFDQVADLTPARLARRILA